MAMHVENEHSTGHRHTTDTVLDQGSLIVETYNTFTHGSGRSNDYTRGYFYRQAEKGWHE